MTKEQQTVALCGDYFNNLKKLFNRYGMEIVVVKDNEEIPGSFWGESEAGLIANRLYLRQDTPVHSAFHEACHFICMDDSRRSILDTDAGGSVEEENGVCYLQILLADFLDCYNRNAMMQDMDVWGYSFRLGSSRAWFEQDAEDARQWLHEAGIILDNNTPSWTLFRQQEIA